MILSSAALSLVLLQGAASAFMAPARTTRRGVTTADVRLSSLIDNEDGGSSNVQEGRPQEEEERVYYSILSQDGPVSSSSMAEQPLMTAGDVLRNDNMMASTTTSTATTSAVTLNGWTPREDYALWGLPGAIAPFSGYFDPIGFCRQGTPLNDAKRLREAEVQHGRVAMMATVGYLAGEWVATEGGGGPLGIVGAANDQLQQVPAPLFWALTVFIASAELYRAKLGWVEPQLKIGSKTLWTLRDSYYPGDLGFDPLGLKPKENYEFQRMQTKELSNGRLAMLGWAGMCSQELVNHKTIAETWDFYQLLFSGGNPYDAYYY